MGHSGESRNPGGYWMPVEDPVFIGDQVRHDGVSLFSRQVNNTKNSDIKDNVDAERGYRPARHPSGEAWWQTLSIDLSKNA